MLLKALLLVVASDVRSPVDVRGLEAAGGRVAARSRGAGCSLPLVLLCDGGGDQWPVVLRA